MKIFNTRSRLILVSVLAIGATAAAAQTLSSERGGQSALRDASLRHADFHDMRGGHHGGFGGRHGGDLMTGLFEAIDTDGDGAVTQREIDAYRDARVGAVDTSGDGALDIGEFDTLYRELTRPRMVDAFQRLDADGDGSVTTEELDERFGSIVERLDRNGDGALGIEDRRGRHRS